MNRAIAGVGWLAGFLALAIIVALGLVTPVNREISAALLVLGNRVPAFNLIWVIGGIPLTALFVLIKSVKRGRSGWWWLAFYLIGLIIEALTKHFLATPMPRATYEPPFYRHLESATNISPGDVHRWLAHLTGTRAYSSLGHHAFFVGSFPSGHVYRITYTLSLWTKKFSFILAVAVAAGILVVATGGHWAFDVVGGFFLARFCVVMAGAKSAR